MPFHPQNRERKIFMDRQHLHLIDHKEASNEYFDQELEKEELEWCQLNLFARMTPEQRIMFLNRNVDSRAALEELIFSTNQMFDRTLARLTR